MAKSKEKHNTEHWLEDTGETQGSKKLVLMIPRKGMPSAGPELAPSSLLRHLRTVEKLQRWPDAVPEGLGHRATEGRPRGRGSTGGSQLGPRQTSQEVTWDLEELCATERGSGKWPTLRKGRKPGFQPATCDWITRICPWPTCLRQTNLNPPWRMTGSFKTLHCLYTFFYT